jgi:hypothetical protein
MRRTFTSLCSLLAVVTCLLLVLPGCHRTTTDTGPQYIMLTFNNAACEQNGSTDVIEIPSNRAVVYQGAAIISQFEVRFAACPFSSCPVKSPYGTSMNVGPPNPGTAGTTFNYTGMTIQNEPCKNAASLGVRIKPVR